MDPLFEGILILCAWEAFLLWVFFKGITHPESVRKRMHAVKDEEDKFKYNLNLLAPDEDPDEYIKKYTFKELIEVNKRLGKLNKHERKTV
jgi:hypothetical protein